MVGNIDSVSATSPPQISLPPPTSNSSPLQHQNDPPSPQNQASPIHISPTQCTSQTHLSEPDSWFNQEDDGILPGAPFPKLPKPTFPYIDPNSIFENKAENWAYVQRKFKILIHTIPPHLNPPNPSTLNQNTSMNLLPYTVPGMLVFLMSQLILFPPSCSTLMDLQ